MAVVTDQFQNGLLDNSGELILASVSLLCSWLSSLWPHTVFASYNEQVSPLYEDTPGIWGRALAGLINSILYFADFEIIKELTNVDLDFLGQTSFSSLYADCDTAKISASPVQVYVSRVAFYANLISKRQEFDFFKYEEANQRFEGFGKSEKEHLRQGKMAALANVRLKSQVRDLELAAGNLDCSHVPILVLDTDCFVFSLDRVKTLLLTKKCIILVSLSGNMNLLSN